MSPEPSSSHLRAPPESQATSKPYSVLLLSERYFGILGFQAGFRGFSRYTEFRPRYTAGFRPNFWPKPFPKFYQFCLRICLNSLHRPAMMVKSRLYVSKYSSGVTVSENVFVRNFWSSKDQFFILAKQFSMMIRFLSISLLNILSPTDIDSDEWTRLDIDVIAKSYCGKLINWENPDWS